MKELNFDIVCGTCGSALKDDETTKVTAFNCSNPRCVNAGRTFANVGKSLARGELIIVDKQQQS